MRRKRRGRFRKEIRRHSPAHFDQSLSLFAEANGKPEEFNPPGLPRYNDLLHRCSLYPYFAAAFAAVRQQRIARLCETRPLAPPQSRPWYSDADYEELCREIRITPHRSKSQFALNLPAHLPTLTSAERWARKSAANAALLERSLRQRGWQKGANFYKTPEGAAVQAAKQLGRGISFTPEFRETLIDEIAAGTSLTQALNLEGAPSYMTVRRYCEANPEYAARVEQAKERWAAKRAATRPALIVDRPEILRGQLLANELYRMADCCVAKGLPSRDDVMADLIEAVLMGEFEREDMPLYVEEFKSAHNRRQGTFASKSLDQTVNDDSDLTYMDRLTSDDFSYAE